MAFQECEGSPTLKEIFDWNAHPEYKRYTIEKVAGSQCIGWNHDKYKVVEKGVTGIQLWDGAGFGF